jgi:hypothetical protein
VVPNTATDGTCAYTLTLRLKVLSFLKYGGNSTPSADLNPLWISASANVDCTASSQKK